MLAIAEEILGLYERPRAVWMPSLRPGARLRDDDDEGEPIPVPVSAAKATADTRQPELAEDAAMAQ